MRMAQKYDLTRNSQVTCNSLIFAEGLVFILLHLLRQPFHNMNVSNSAQHASDSELRPIIEGCKRGERRAQQQVFERYYRLMFGVCLRYISDHDSVQDVLQEGFLKVFSNIEGYTSKGSFEGWIRRIMVNTAIDFIRRKRAAGWESGDEATMEGLESDEPLPDELDEEVGFTVQDVLQAMERLTPVYRAVFNLYVFENLGHQEISEELGISVGTSKSNLAKARRNIRNHLLTRKGESVK